MANKRWSNCSGHLVQCPVVDTLLTCYIWYSQLLGCVRENVIWKAPKTTYRVAQKSKLLILCGYVNEERQQTRTTIEKMKHCLIFSPEIFLSVFSMFKYSMTESSQTIIAKQS